MKPLMNIEWRCANCRWGAVDARAQVIARLRTLGMLARDEPDDDTLWELIRVSAARLKCPACDAAGLLFERARDDDAELWGDPIPCEGCGAIIPAERLEVYPNCELCAACQNKLERGSAVGPSDYCPRCGAPMVVRPSRGGGITRYVAICSQGPRCGR